MLELATKIYNSTPSPSLLNLSPNQASLPNNVAALQAFYLSRRARRATKLKKPAKYHEGQLVKKAVVDPFKQRGDRPRLSQANYTITKVLDKAVPTTYEISGHEGKVFYEQQLFPVANQEELQKSVRARRILVILHKKNFPVQFLRSGRPLKFELRFLVKTNEREENYYITKPELLEFDNGEQALEKFESLSQAK